MPDKKSLKLLKKSFILQKDQSDCGVACLQNILHYHGVEISLERLRELSGTDKHGTTLLGLYQAAEQIGFKAQGCEAEGVHNLSEVKYPCILHLTINDHLLHYVIYYPSFTRVISKKEGEIISKVNGYIFLIGDPGKGIEYYTANELEALWKSKAALLLEPTEKLNQYKQTRKTKWKWFKNILKEDVELLWLAAFLGTIMAVLNLSTALFSQQLIDKILPQSQHTKLFLGVILLTILLIAKSGIGYTRQFLLIRQAYQFNIRLTGGFYKSLLYLKKAFFDNRKTGDLIARLNDTMRIQSALSYIIGDISIQVLLLLVSVIFIFCYSWVLGLAAIGIIPVIYGVVKAYEKEILLRQRNMMIAHAHNESNYVDTIKGISIIKSLNKESIFEKMGIKIFSCFQETIFQLSKTKMRFNLAIEIVSTIFLTSIILCSSVMVLHHTLTIGSMMAVLQMAIIVMHAAASISLTNIQLQEAKVAFDRMYEFSASEPEYIVEETNGKKRITNDLNFENLLVEKISFRFPGKKSLLTNVSFAVHKQEIVTIVGESGQGKSTLLQILQKMYSIENGNILVNGKPLKEIDVVSWRKMIGVVPQEVTLFSGTLLDNILLEDKPENTEQVIQFCHRYGFHHYFKEFPQHYYTILGEGGVNLSGGQKQLVALARCLYPDPQLLLLDEPTSSMDKMTEQFVLNLLNNLKATKAILVISHRDSITSIADKVYELVNGHLQLRGSRLIQKKES
mgnify:CR=1 FL=1